MDGDPFPAAERIIIDMESIFKKDPKLKEFKILLTTVNKNKSPVHHEEHCLGLESWCVSHVYCYIHSRLMDIKQQKRQQKDVQNVNRLLIVALLLNPETSLFWNMRRELIINERLDPQFELLLTSVILPKKPKSSEVFTYRKWLIKTFFNSFQNDRQLLSNEFYLCGLASDLYSNNYYAWNHRIWCLESLTDNSTFIRTNVEEWERSLTYVSSHVSDYSGFHYRQKVLQNLISTGADSTVMKQTYPSVTNQFLLSLRIFLQSDENIFLGDYKFSKTTLKIAKDSLETCIISESVFLGLIVFELLFNTDLLFTFPGHEAIWCHRRFILHVYLKFIKQIENINCHKDINGIPVEKDAKLESISEFLERRLQCFENILINHSYKEQAQYVERHLKWMTKVLKLSLFKL